eukprot:1288741-Rhodomonas_salina.1
MSPCLTALTHSCALSGTRYAPEYAPTLTKLHGNPQIGPSGKLARHCCLLSLGPALALIPGYAQHWPQSLTPDTRELDNPCPTQCTR